MVTVITKTVEAKSSLRVDQETLESSTLTSFKKFIGLAKILIFHQPNYQLLCRSYLSKTTGAAGFVPSL